MNTNVLSEFPDFANCTNVTAVYLKWNQITNIPAKKLDILTKLVWLRMSYNLLQAFPDVPGPGNTLTYLFLDYNAFSEMPMTRVIGRNLRALAVSGNSIRDIPRVRLEHLERLTGFRVGVNPLQRFPDVEPILATLERLELKHSPGVGIPSGLFPRLPSIAMLTLFDVDAPTVPIDICLRGELPMDFNVGLGGNPFRCDQGLIWLRLAEEAGISVSVETSCYHSDTSSYKAWEDAELQDLFYSGMYGHSMPWDTTVCATGSLIHCRCIMDTVAQRVVSECRLCIQKTK